VDGIGPIAPPEAQRALVCRSLVGDPQPLDHGEKQARLAIAVSHAAREGHGRRLEYLALLEFKADRAL